MNEEQKEESLENALITSIHNPRHCLYFREKNKTQAVGKTLLNANESYQLEELGEHQMSVVSHEQFHIISTNLTQFKKVLLLSSIVTPYEIPNFSEWPVKVSSFKSSTDFQLIYNSEIVPFLEVFALLYQCRLGITSIDLKEAIIDELSFSNPGLYGMMIDLEDLFERIMAKCKTKEYMSAGIFSLLANLVFSSPDITRDRVFDRFRLLRDMEKITEWHDFNKIAKYLRDYLYSNGFATISLSLGSAEGIVSTAKFIHSIKEISSPEGVLKPFLFGILSEVDPQIGRISYSCKDLHALEGKKINHCYMGNIWENKAALKSLEILIGNTEELLKNSKYSGQYSLLKEFDADVKKLVAIKKKVFKSCPGPKYCKGKSECQIFDQLYREVAPLLLKQD